MIIDVALAFGQVLKATWKIDGGNFIKEVYLEACLPEFLCDGVTDKFKVELSNCDITPYGLGYTNHFNRHLTIQCTIAGPNRELCPRLQKSSQMYFKSLQYTSEV